MPRRPATDTLRPITVRVRHLGTHEVEEHVVERWVPSDHAMIREILIETVEQWCPGARTRARTYVDGVISFLLPGKLVVAALGERLAVRVPDEEPQLFRRDVA